MSKEIYILHQKDLRVQDNRALFEANNAGTPIPFVIIDPYYFKNTKICNSRRLFYLESVKSLSDQYYSLGIKLLIYYGKSKKVIDKMTENEKITIYLNYTYGDSYDKARIEYIKNHTTLKTFNDTALIETGRTTEWSEKAQNYFDSETYTVSKIKLKHNKHSENTIEEIHNKLMVSPDKHTIEKGGSEEAEKLLSKFLENLHLYPKNISKPFGAEIYNSRLSTHITLGTISVKQIYKRVNQLDIKQKRFYKSRLFWNQHFIQKFVDNPSLIEKSANPVYRYNYNKIYFYNKDYIKAWQEGKTGYPLVDASMRALVKTGFINFRMRAMVASFYCFILKQDWKTGADFMYSHLLDADIAINYSQWQMQAGQVGVHPNRIYNPTKQIHDNDFDCKFIKKYVPELREVNNDIIKMAPEGRINSFFKNEYILPIVDFTNEAKKAREIYTEINKTAFKEVSKNANLRKRLSLASVGQKRIKKKEMPETKIV